MHEKQSRKWAAYKYSFSCKCIKIDENFRMFRVIRVRLLRDIRKFGREKAENLNRLDRESVLNEFIKDEGK